MNTTDTASAGRGWLTLAAALSFGVALLHVGIILAGPSAYTYFGAGDLAPLAAQGSPVPAIMTSVLVMAFGAFGLYALSGAAWLRRLPLLAFALAAIGAVYTLRGLALLPEVYQLARGAAAFPPRYAAFSAVSLAIGIAYLVGTAQRWRWLRGR